ncbi:hypothetical protein BKA66DRAFT_143509 [Pyrenochaeta sp. MPI-SDFR-AT-0127]|nr:hypothetical protein BKA66DRAFT_143509 [Pyrenochaeta sp. MPI-SDFR-AT-0127]
MVAKYITYELLCGFLQFCVCMCKSCIPPPFCWVDMCGSGLRAHRAEAQSYACVISCPIMQFPVSRWWLWCINIPALPTWGTVTVKVKESRIVYINIGLVLQVFQRDSGPDSCVSLQRVNLTTDTSWRLRLRFILGAASCGNDVICLEDNMEQPMGSMSIQICSHC